MSIPTTREQRRQLARDNVKLPLVGVYAIEQISTGIVYVGRSINIHRRWATHCAALIKGSHHAKWLQRVWTKRGKNDFKFYILEECSIDEIRDRERHWIGQFEATFNNMLPSNRDGVMLHAPESRAKMSLSQKARGYIPSAEHVALMHKRRRETVGYTSSPEKRKRMSESARKKAPPSAETREKLRQANLRRVYPPMSEEQKEKLRIAHTGKKNSQEHREKISQGGIKAWAKKQSGG